MLSIPHLVVIFIVALIVFGPQKLPELARGLGKLMAEFRKASLDFRSAFEEEMRDLDRQAREVELRKQQLAPQAAPAQAPASDSVETHPSEPANATSAEPASNGAALSAPAESVARESDIPESTEEKAATVEDTAHDHQQRA